MTDSLSIAQARRVALAAQGFTHPDRSKRVTWSAMNRMIRQLNLLQIDSVNVLVRSHYLPLYSRLGAYSHGTLDERAFGRKKRALFECWAHEASLLPMELHPLMRWRMHRVPTCWSAEACRFKGAGPSAGSRCLAGGPARRSGAFPA